MIVTTIIYEVGIINVRFYLLDVLYPHKYCKINFSHFLGHALDIKILTGVAV